MIITGLHAENVLKYSLLELTDIPEHALIAVIGDNESGKSSIGECICFALFGRTFSCGGDELGMVIRWGESRCSIRLDFKTSNGDHYQIARFLDELGNHGASISPLGENPIVRGVAATEERLKELIGFGYIEFIESFYLAQREISTPNPHGDAVKAMAGIDAMEQASIEIRNELDYAETSAQETRRDHEQVARKISELSFDEQLMPRLEQQRKLEFVAIDRDRQAHLDARTTADEAGRDLAVLGEVQSRLQSLSHQTSLLQRREEMGHLGALVSQLEPRWGEREGTAQFLAAMRSLHAEIEERLATFDDLAQAALRHRVQLARKLGYKDSAGRAEAEPTFARLHTEQAATIAATRRAIGRNRLVGFLCLLPALVLGAAWGLLTKLPELPGSKALAAMLDQALPIWPDLLGGAGVAAAMLGAGYFFSGLRTIWLKRRLGDQLDERESIDADYHNAQRDHEALGALPERSLPDIPLILSRVTSGRLIAQIARLQSTGANDLIDEESERALSAQLSDALDALAQSINDGRNSELATARTLEEDLRSRATRSKQLEEMIAREQVRVRHHTELTAIANNIAQKLSSIEHRIRVRTLAVDLLKGGIHYISQRFNTEVRNLSGNSLPRFTSGRYEHLQIDHDLKVKAFSAEKRDFMVLDEISSGTQRQIMLAVRLALSQKLVNSVIHGPQMIFLDEPFAFFDEPRTASSLAVLPQVSKDFSQIWVTSQTFPAQSHFDITIECLAAENHSPRIRRAA